MGHEVRGGGEAERKRHRVKATAQGRKKGFGNTPVSSNRLIPAVNLVTYTSMLRDSHVRLVSPGCVRRSRACTHRVMRERVMGLIIPTTRSYSFRAYIS